jgi:hypothetical protein
MKIIGKRIIIEIKIENRIGKTIIEEMTEEMTDGMIEGTIGGRMMTIKGETENTQEIDISTTHDHVVRIVKTSEKET